MKLTREQIEDYRERFYQVLGKELADEVCDLALAALGGGWQPIETAPKDGTEILLHGPTPETPDRVTSGSWYEPAPHPFSPDIEEREDDVPGWLSWDGGFSEEYPPTRWQPLPSAPLDL